MKLPEKVLSALQVIQGRMIYRITVILACAFAVIVVTILGLGYLETRRLEKRESAGLAMKADLMLNYLASSQHGKFGVIVGNVKVKNEANEKPLLEKAAELVTPDPEVVYVAFYNLNGEKIFFHPAEDEEDFNLAPPSWEPGKSKRPIVSALGAKVLDAVKPIRSGLASAAKEDQGKPEDLVGYARIGLSMGGVETVIADIKTIAAVLLAMLFILGGALTFFLQRMIAQPIMNIAEAANQVSQGNLAVRFSTPSKDELGILASGFNDMIRSIQDQIAHTSVLVQNLSETIDLITQTTNDIYSISAQQSSGATEQAASVYQASSTSKEIAASATRIAETAEIVSENARRTSEASGDGRVELGQAITQVQEVYAKVEEVAARMVELGGKSQKISGIIAIINEISEQTNLLSLNAAIEAASAGEAGRRFSVVAQEIRRLAGRTLEATEVVKQLVEEIQSATNVTVMVTEQSMKSAKEGADTIERMNQSFHHILELVERTLNASTEITLSTRQQTTACEQMVSTVMEVSEVASEVEKGAKETETALGKLRELSAHLKELTGTKIS